MSRSTKATTNYGSSTSLSVDGSPVEIVYMRFDASALAGKTITSAILRLRISNSSSSTQAVKDVANITWNESGVTYNTRPALGSTIASITGSSSGTNKDIVLTPYVSTKTGQLFTVGIDSAGSNGLGFYSKERSTNKPVLIVTYQ